MSPNPIVLKVRLAGWDFTFLDYGQDVWLQTLKAGDSGHIEVMSLSLWAQMASTSKVIFDVGGFNGMYSLVAARAAPFATTLAFEPMPLTYGALVMNVMGNGLAASVTAVNVALGRESGRATISSLAGPYVMASGESMAVDGWEYQYEVQVLRFDSVWEEGISIQGWPRTALRRTPDLMKIDVEGFETEVLDGMLETLNGRESGPDIVVECLSPTSLVSFADQVPWRHAMFHIDEESFEVERVATEGTEFAGPGNYWLTSRPAGQVKDLVKQATRMANEGTWGITDGQANS